MMYRDYQIVEIDGVMKLAYYDTAEDDHAMIDVPVQLALHLKWAFYDRFRGGRESAAKQILKKLDLQESEKTTCPVCGRENEYRCICGGRGV